MRLPLPIPEIKKLLLKDGLVTPEHFDELVTEADRKGQNLLDVLVSGQVVAEDYLANLIATSLGVPRVDFSTHKLDSEVVKLLPEDVARQRGVIVFNKEKADGTYDVGMLDPSDLETVTFLSQRLKARVKPFLATPGDLNRGFSVYGYALEQDFKKLIEENVRASVSGGSKSAEESAADLPIVAIVDNVLSYAVASRASDIHIEILEESTFIRYRIDGILYEIMTVPKVVHPAIVARIKLLAGLKIDEHFRPQDGRFREDIGSQAVDVRVSVIPTFFGEKVEMRLLEASAKPLSLEELGFSVEDKKIITENLKKSYGMILSCGPTGSGKTTTLYALMGILNKPQVNVTTVEDPIEYNMRYVNQTQINEQAGITFASGLRALLRQDPNIIMVGEIRDAETAEIAVQAALTGHLLLSSIHTNDAPTAVPRLFDLKVPPFLAASVLNIVIAQRLVRRICQTCIYSYEATPEIVTTVEKQLEELGLAKGSAKAPHTLYKGKGCSTCGETGYRGRLGIYELFEITEPIKKIMTSEHFDLEALRAEARKAGMKTMFEDGLLKVELAQTTLEDVLRVIRE
ncbi:MAG TPA: ATPase, T2SS/T4P/T4SS family [Candidatus Paceibacterota bacterium]|jgi:type IV pilus assembly protein PilB|nr:ATPase, T2SS/T4P/T4SS family [Candidatus Paceibacterota bacterium]